MEHINFVLAIMHHAKLANIPEPVSDKQKGANDYHLLTLSTAQ